MELWANSANNFFDTLAASKPILINYGGWQKLVIENENIGYVLPEKLSKKAINEFVKYTHNISLYSQQKINALQKLKNHIH